MGEEFARQELFFRRVRIPPLLQVYWHNIFVIHSAQRMLLCFVTDHDGCLRSSRRSIERRDQTQTLASKAALPVGGIEFMRDTFALIALARDYTFADDGTEKIQCIRAAKKGCKAKYPKSGPLYRVKTDFRPLMLQQR